LLPELSVLRTDAIRYASWQGGDCSLRGRKGRAACSIANQRRSAVGGSGNANAWRRIAIGQGSVPETGAGGGRGSGNARRRGVFAARFTGIFLVYHN
jgi:hypothetical protein